MKTADRILRYQIRQKINYLVYLLKFFLFLNQY